METIAEPTEQQHAQDDILKAYCELRESLDKPQGGNAMAALAKVMTLAAMVEAAGDVEPFVWKAVDKEFRCGAFNFVLGIIGQAIQESKK